MKIFWKILLIILIIFFAVIAIIFLLKEKIFIFNKSQIVGDSVFVERVSILAFGDMMLDRNVYLQTQKSKDFNYPFLNIDSFLKEADIRMANLEGPITSFNSVAIKDNRMRFTISPDFLPALKSRFEILGLANNHMLDFGEDGYNQTKEFLGSAGIKYFGDFKNRPENLFAIIEKNKIKIGFVGYHALDFKNLEEIVKEIKDIKSKTDFVIVFAHWGGEYQTKPVISQKEEAKMFIDAGADFVLGSHPHVVQPNEEYKGKPIFYSLGNFVFDQYFSEATMEGLAIKILLEKSGNEIKFSYNSFLIKISKDSQPELKQ